MPDDRIAFLAVEAILLAIATIAGGPPWTIPLAVAATIVGFVALRPAAIAALLPAFVWLALAAVTGNRELFFPYCMHLAGQVASRPNGAGRFPRAVAGVAVVATFLAIRVAQRATPRVLLVEAAAAAAILVAVEVATRAIERVRPGSRAAAPAIALGASLLAYAALAL